MSVVSGEVVVDVKEWDIVGRTLNVIVAGYLADSRGRALEAIAIGHGCGVA